MTGSLDNPRISEGGRAFLAAQLNKLRDAQIRGLFSVSNVVKRGEQIEVDGKKRAVIVDDWVRAFKKKRAEIASAHCPAKSASLCGFSGSPAEPLQTQEGLGTDNGIQFRTCRPCCRVRPHTFRLRYGGFLA